MKASNLRKLTLVSAVAFAASWGTLTHAATDTADLTVSSTVVNNCDISTDALAFGNYDPAVVNASADVDATGSVSVTCTSGAAVAITLGQGSAAATESSDAIPLRRMKDAGTNHLSYSLFSDAGRTSVWTNDTEGDVETTGIGTAEAHTIYGRIAGGQNMPAGAYTDTVVATVTF